MKQYLKKIYFRLYWKIIKPEFIVGKGCGITIPKDWNESEKCSYVIDFKGSHSPELELKNKREKGNRKND